MFNKEYLSEFEQFGRFHRIVKKYKFFSFHASATSGNGTSVLENQLSHR